jgi:predicted flap endonuclease-1-like 5' DNA nuclease
MTSIAGLALIILGLAIGFIIAWAFGVLSGGVSVGLVIGLLLLVAGAIVGFVSEWLIDEAYRKNRELQRQLRELGTATPPLIELSTPNQLPLLQPEDVPIAHRLSPGEQNHILASETFTNFLRQRDEELREMRQQLAATDTQIDTLRHEFDIYQRTHPDNLRVIKGIGPVYQWKLRDAGINTYKQLALADPDQIRRLLAVKKWQRVNTEAWVEQARDWAQRGP